MNLLLITAASTLAFLSTTSAPVATKATLPPAQMQGGAPKQPASPPAKAETMLNGKAVSIAYSAPSLRGRVMIGEHDPYDKVWRTGANSATSFTTATDLKIGDLSVPAGSYTIFTLPEAPGKPWMLIVNKQTGQWGLEYHPEQDLGRTALMSKTLPASQEVMSISFENVHGKSAELHIRWDKADEYVKVEAK